LEDACDGCPTVPDTPVDTDGDGLGDACEWPFDWAVLSSVEFDTFRRFEGYVTNEPAMWAQSGDVVTGSGSSGNAFSPLGALAPPYSVEATYSLEARSMSPNFAGVVFGDASPAHGVTYLACGFDTQRGELALWEATGSGLLLQVMAVAVITSARLDEWRRVRVDVAPTGLVTCRYIDATGARAETSPVTHIYAVGPGWAGLRLYDANAVFRSFAVYRP
jgi:hypothetical protein